MPNEYLVDNKRLGRVGSWRTDAFNWKHLLPDLQEKIKQATGVSFKVQYKSKWRLSREYKYDRDRPDDAYDPMLHVVQTFEFSRPRTDTLGLGLVHFKYSQRAEAEPRPASEHDNYVTQEYVDKVVTGMQHDIDWNDISKIRLLRWDYDGCTFEVVRKIDGSNVTIKLDGRPGDNDTGIIKPNFAVGWNGWHYKHHAHQFKDELELTFSPQKGQGGDPVDEYSVERLNPGRPHK
jgi:hypothetical protein